MSAPARPLWLREFGPEYAIPQEILTAPGLVDASWGNNSCPSFEASIEDDAAIVVLWVEHPEPWLRIDEDAPRFAISAVFQGRSEEQDTSLRAMAGLPAEEWQWVWVGEDVAAALAAVRVWGDKVRAVLQDVK